MTRYRIKTYSFRDGSSCYEAQKKYSWWPFWVSVNSIARPTKELALRDIQIRNPKVSYEEINEKKN